MKPSPITPRRTCSQSARLWAIASDVAGSGYKLAGREWSKDAWFRIFVAGVYKQLIVPNLNGDGVVFVDARTSRMTKEQISEVIAFAEAWCAEQGIQLRGDPALPPWSGTDEELFQMHQDATLETMAKAKIKLPDGD